MINKPSAIIADDEKHLANFLQDRLSALWPELNVQGTAKNGLDAIRLIISTRPDIAFLDIRMPGLTGLEVASSIPSGTHVVFVTAFDQYAVEAFERQAVDYLLKPVTDERLSQTISRLKEKLLSSKMPHDVTEILKQLAQILPPQKKAYMRWIRASAGDVVRQIPIEEVLYLQAQDKYVSIHSKDGEFLIRSSLTDLQAQLDPDDFWQIHRSTIINVRRVVSTHRDVMGHTQVKLKDCKNELAVSRVYEHLFKQL